MVRSKDCAFDNGKGKLLELFDISSLGTLHVLAAAWESSRKQCIHQHLPLFFPLELVGIWN